MAVIICISFCLSYATAADSGWQDFENGRYYYFVDNNNSCAYVYCTNFGWNEETYTDFAAYTQANDVYLGSASNLYIQAYVYVVLGYSDEILTISKEAHEEYPGNTWGISVTACVDGNDLIDMDHGIEFFTSEHAVYICDYVNGEYIPEYQHGSSIYIGITQ